MKVKADIAKYEEIVRYRDGDNSDTREIIDILKDALVYGDMSLKQRTEVEQVLKDAAARLGRNPYLSEIQFRKLLGDLIPLSQINYFILEAVIKDNPNVPSDLLTKMAYECTEPNTLYEVASHKNTTKEARVIAGLRGG